MTLKFESITTFFAIVGVIILMLFSISVEARAISYDNDLQLKFTWSAASGNVDHYNVYVSTDDSEYVLGGITFETSYIVNGENGHTYKVRVQAVDAAGNAGPMSAESDSATCDTVPPGAVNDLSPTVSGDHILLEWTSSVDAAGYNIYRDRDRDFIPDQTDGSNRIATGVNDEDSALPGIQWTDTSDYVVKNPDSNYFYIITAVDAARNESDLSNKVGEFDIKLVAGAHNLISLPLKLSVSYTSHRLIEEIPSDMAMPFLPKITRFNSNIQNWESAYWSIVDIGGVDFPIVEGEGYDVEVSSDTIQTFTGDVITTPVPLDLRRGNNLVAIPYSAEKYTSYSLIAAIPNCRHVLKYNTDTLSYDIATLDRLGAPVGVDFEIKTGESYYVYVTEDTSWTPDTIAAPMVAPKRTELVQNYPNPFNPETWIPFQLSKASEVNIRIYNTAGQRVKTLQIGYKQPGSYIARSKAAYWDGRNDMGEKVASGVYFYELRTETFSSIRKMILLK